MADIKVNHSGGIDGSDALMGRKLKITIYRKPLSSLKPFSYATC
jgi:hypothetical protein